MYEFGDKPGKQLAKILEQSDRGIRILIMKSGRGEEIAHLEKKLGLFRVFFFPDL